MRRSFLALLLFAGLATSALAIDLNDFRARHGRPPLRVDSTLTGLAYYHALDLARRNALDHRGFATERARFGANAENVSYGCADEPCAVLQWARSPRHRANMLMRDVTAYGLASAVSASGRRYWVMELGGAPPIMIAPRARKAYLQSGAGRPTARGPAE
jgi:uncharacterized protein YkwD